MHHQDRTCSPRLPHLKGNLNLRKACLYYACSISTKRLCNAPTEPARTHGRIRMFPESGRRRHLGVLSRSSDRPASRSMVNNFLGPMAGKALVLADQQGRSRVNLSFSKVNQRHATTTFRSQAPNDSAFASDLVYQYRTWGRSLTT